MNRYFRDGLQEIWWRKSKPPLPLRWLEKLYSTVADVYAIRRKREAVSLPVPVIVVGNIAIGGTGKTPITLALVEMLKALGCAPGVLSRGYGGTGPFPLLVSATTAPQRCGDEPALIAQRAFVPVCVGPSRVAAGRMLLAAHPQVDVLLCDDGLQHYRLARELELCVIDGARGHGNGHQLPAGPLRELPARQAQCALILVNGADAAAYGRGALRFDLRAENAVHLRTGKRCSLSEFAGCEVDAVAGIGNPRRFFDLLSAQGINVRAHAFADHHHFEAGDFAFASNKRILMTEKDAVKCRMLTLPDEKEAELWFVPVAAEFSLEAELRVQQCLRSAIGQPRRKS